MAKTEHAITQAWQRYSKELSTKALAEAEATTKRLAVLHRRLASRLEHIAGEGVGAGVLEISVPHSTLLMHLLPYTDTPPLRISVEVPTGGRVLAWFLGAQNSVNVVRVKRLRQYDAIPVIHRQMVAGLSADGLVAGVVHLHVMSTITKLRQCL